MKRSSKFIFLSLCCTMLFASAKAAESNEATAAAMLDKLANYPAGLRVFLQAMPKGGDLHNHLSGTAYAEDFLDWAAEKGFCAHANGLEIVPPPCPADSSLRAVAQSKPFVHAKLVNSLSTRGFQQGVGAGEASGHTHFFSSFDRFYPIAAQTSGQMIATAQQSAAQDKLIYLELMHLPKAIADYALAATEQSLDEKDIADFYRNESDKLPELIAAASAEVDQDEATANSILNCGRSAAQLGCDVTVRYLGFTLRAFKPAQAFRLLIASFALADKDPRYVGVNIVQPEDWPVSLRDYDLHMQMYRFLHKRYPTVGRTMHAGELTMGLVPPRHLRNHIAKAIDAHAQRIGHGTAIAFEDQAAGTMRRMAQEGIAVEINLSSNAVILGVEGGNHPLHLYRAMGVPIIISTDDMGVLRTDMTNEYLRAVKDQGLRYLELKQIARASLEYAFISGESLWAGRSIGKPTPACASSLMSEICKRHVSNSKKAQLQIRLENEFSQFESNIISDFNNKEIDIKFK
jgi:adenosine deaminase